MNTVIAKRDLLESCKDRDYREALNLENVYVGICGQIRVLREQRDMSQAKLGRKAKMAQERISILEDPNAETKPTLNTLLRVASAFDIGLDVRFVPFSTVLDRAVNTDPNELEVPSFEDDPAFKEPAVKEPEMEEGNPGLPSVGRDLQLGKIMTHWLAHPRSKVLHGMTFKQLALWTPTTGSFPHPRHPPLTDTTAAMGLGDAGSQSGASNATVPLAVSGLGAKTSPLFEKPQVVVSISNGRRSHRPQSQQLEKENRRTRSQKKAVGF